ncbi:MAG: DUF2147 domain-containing protein [Burkholderiales bacterium]|nr:MAG: DUF2147 domain-containing protein [Burkholderiales bacterium]
MPKQAAVLAGRTLLATFLVASGAAALAQSTPVGRWKTIDDNTGEAKSEVVISESAGVLNGRIDKLLRKDADQNAKCDKCPDDRKDKPTVGLEILRGAKKAEGKDVWEGGKILDPESGTIYSARLTPVDGGRKLEMRAFVGMALLGRTQTWIRVP